MLTILGRRRVNEPGVLSQVLDQSCKDLRFSYLVGSVVNNQIHHQLHITALELGNQIINIIHSAVLFMDIAIVRLVHVSG